MYQIEPSNMAAHGFISEGQMLNPVIVLRSVVKAFIQQKILILEMDTFQSIDLESATIFLYISLLGHYKCSKLEVNERKMIKNESPPTLWLYKLYNIQKVNKEFLIMPANRL